jgi:leucyl aminopeptidase
MFTQNLKTKHHLKIFLVFKETSLSSLNKYVSIPEKIQEDFNRNTKQIISFYDKQKPCILVSLEKKKDINIDKLRNILSLLKIQRKTYKDKKILYFLEENDNSFLEDQIQEIAQTHYSFNYKKTKTNQKTNKKSKKNNLTHEFKIFLKTKKINLQNQTILSNSIKLLKNLGDEPANILTPDNYVDRIKSVCKECGLKLKIHTHNDLKKMKMNSILSVADGSKYGGYLLEIKCDNNKHQPPIVLVGKGITFDTGGISLKWAKKMYEMKGDMIGSAIVLAVMRNVALMKLKKNVVALLPIAENMIDGTSTRPGDIITSYSGKTIEIRHTDAEGRLIMADALSYAQEFNPRLIIDIAKLTGQQASLSCGLFGSIMGNKEETIKNLIKLGNKTNDRLVELPLYNEFRENVKSKIADVKNAEYKCKASTIHAGAFLSHFVNREQDWIHIDVAGPTFLKGKTTGYGVRLLTEYLKN